MLFEKLSNIIQEHNKNTHTIKLKIEEMRDFKKDNYWGTSVRHYTSDGKNKYNEVGTIYINRRDCVDDNKIIQVLKHEFKHLIDKATELDWLLNELRKVEEGFNASK